MPAEVMCGDRPTMLFRVPKLWSILLTPANYERGTVRSVRGSDARSGGSLWPKLRFSWQCLLILLIAALLLVSPLTARAMTPRYNLRKGFGRYLAMLVLSRLGALPIARSANSTISICFNHLVGEGAAEDRLDVVTIWIEHKCSVVIRPAQTGRSVFDSAWLERGRHRPRL
jgi:hypothetical protein